MDFNFSLIFWILGNECFLNGEEEEEKRINVKILFLPWQAWPYILEWNGMSDLVKKGYLGLVWLLILFDFFFLGLSFKLEFLCECN